MEKNELLQGWSREKILTALKDKGITLRGLSIEMGFSGGALYQVLKGDTYPSYERLVADFLGVAVEEIWPERVAARKEKAERRERSLLEAKALAARQVA
ncbi:MAG: helix-turn-helix domain-containing protein [Plesiomonas sp.]